MNIQETEAEQAAEQLIERFNLNTLPICPFDLAAKHDIEVHPKVSDDEGVSGFLMCSENTFGIMYATHIKNEGFIRFSVAHELGHYIIPGHCQVIFPPGQILHRSRSGYISGDPIERQADVFATTVLMPQQLFIPALREAGEGFDAIESLAETCKTSVTATAIRFAQYADDPVAVLLSTGGIINCCFVSRAISAIPGIRRVKKGSTLPLRSATAAFNKTTTNVSGAKKAAAWTSLNDWFDDAPDVEMKEDVVGLGSYGRTLTVLFTAEAIDDETDD